MKLGSKLLDARLVPVSAHRAQDLRRGIGRRIGRLPAGPSFVWVHRRRYILSVVLECLIRLIIAVLGRTILFGLFLPNAVHTSAGVDVVIDGPI
jgi:hypothetical protein